MTTLRDDALLGSSASNPAGASDATGQERITLRRPAGADTFVDGGWWPRTLDLVAELPALLTAGEAAGYGPIRRISYSLTAWDGRPPRITTMLDRVFKLGGFRSQNPAEITLVDSSGWKRCTVVVVPPGTDPAEARRALTMAGTDGDPHRAREILDMASAGARS